MENASTIRPGLLVSIKTSLRGNVSYRKTELEHLRASEASGADITKWQTERTIADAAEHALAVKVRSDATYTVGRICAATAFGYLCPEEKVNELEQAIKLAHAKVGAFNESAKVTRLGFYVICGRVARDDEEAARAINAELSDLMATMRAGVESLDSKTIRDAAKRAQQVAAMLSDDGRARVAETVEKARATATAINKAIRAGEQAAIAVDQQALAALETARVSFLDLDDMPLQVERAELVPARALDL